MSSSKRCVVLLFVAAVVLLPTSTFATLVTYTDSSWALGATLGSASLTCTPNVACVAVTVTFVADTKNIVPFSVTGASGYENFVGHGSISLAEVSGSTVTMLSGNFPDGQIYLGLDQTNGGIGFGSMWAPTYPLATYGGTPTIPYSSYDLKSNFSVLGWSWFCPVPVCWTGPPLETDKGTVTVLPTGPIPSFFTATVMTPEPPTLILMAVGLASLISRKTHLGRRL